jgi:hypothetical protein
MKTRVFLAIGIRIVILFGIGMAATYIPEQLRSFFGDTLHVHNDVCKKAYDGCVNGVFDELWEWGARHYWYYWMMVVLFTLSLANFVLSIINVVRKNYNTSEW